MYFGLKSFPLNAAERGCSFPVSVIQEHHRITRPPAAVTQRGAQHPAGPSSITARPATLQDLCNWTRFVLITYLPVKTLRFRIKGKEIILGGYFNEKRNLYFVSQVTFFTLKLPGLIIRNLMFCELQLFRNYGENGLFPSCPLA